MLENAELIISLILCVHVFDDSMSPMENHLSLLAWSCLANKWISFLSSCLCLSKLPSGLKPLELRLTVTGLASMEDALVALLLWLLPRGVVLLMISVEEVAGDLILLLSSPWPRS